MSYDCENCGFTFTDDAELIDVAFHDPNLVRDPYWVKVTYHPRMTYLCVVAQIMRIARATWGQEPTVTEIQVMADDLQWQAEMNDLVDMQGITDFGIYVYCTSVAEDNSTNGANNA